MPIKILMADNDPDFLATRQEFLERKGYVVIPAFSPLEAQKKMKEESIHLAILDIRLINDDDENDTSGLELARTFSYSVPTLILTSHPTVEYVRRAMRPHLDGRPGIFDFLTKQEGPEALITAIQRALEVNTRGRENITAPFLLTQRPMLVALGFLLALGAGGLAIIYGEARWLLGSLVLSVIALAISFLGHLDSPRQNR